MRAKLWIASAFIASLSLLPACSHLMGEKEKDEGGKDEEKVKIDNVPAAVRTTIDEQTKGGVVEDIAKESEDGKTVYEVDAKMDGKDYEIKIAADGKLISKKLDEDEDEKGKNKAEDDDDKAKK